MFVHKEQLYTRFEQIAWEDLGGGVRRKIMAYGDQLMAVYLEFKKGAVGALHAHPHVQAAFVRSGSVQVQIGEESFASKQANEWPWLVQVRRHLPRDPPPLPDGSNYRLCPDERGARERRER